MRSDIYKGGNEAGKAAAWLVHFGDIFQWGGGGEGSHYVGSISIFSVLTLCSFINSSHTTTSNYKISEGVSNLLVGFNLF